MENLKNQMEFDDLFTESFVAEAENLFPTLDLTENIEVIWNDICRLHTEIADGTPGEHCVEIRALKRKRNAKGICDKATKGLHFWKDDKKSKDRFYKWYKENIENQGVCLYVSVHCFDSEIEAKQENGKAYNKYRINKHNQLYTRVLVADLDHVTEAENKDFDDTMDMLKIPFQSIHTSKDGYQKRIFLKEQIGDEYAISKFTKLLFNKGFKVDTKLINRGQVIRLNGSVNNKCFSDNFPDRNSQFKVYSVRDTNKIISAKELWEKIKTLSNKQNKYEVEDIDFNLNIEISKNEYKSTAYYNESSFKNNYYNVVPNDYLTNLQKPIKYMLTDSPEGFTDAVVMFIIPYLKNTLKLSFEQTKKIMDKWAELNNYTETDKYERIYYTEYQKGFGAYTDDLKKRYGSINFAKSYDTVIKINDNTANLRPSLFDEDLYPNLDKTALKVFIALLFEYKAQGKITWSLDEVIKYNGISKPTAIKSLKELTNKEFISCKTYFKGDKKPNDYTIQKTYIAAKTERRIEFTLSELDRMLSKLKGNEIKLFIYMKYMVLKSPEESYYGNQENIAEYVGIKQQTVSDILISLEKKRLINTERIKLDGKKTSNIYTLLL